MEFPCKNFWSHKNVQLKDHLKIVGERAVNTLREQGISDPLLLKTAEIIGKVHDFGKYTQYFQRKLKGEKNLSTKLTSHAALSSLLAAWLVHKYVGDPTLTYGAYIAVKHHHQALYTLGLTEELYNVINLLKDDHFGKQLSSIRSCKKKIEEELREIGLNGFSDFLNAVEANMFQQFFSELVERVKERQRGDDFWENVAKIQLLFSALIHSDKFEAGEVMIGRRFNIPYDLVDQCKPKSSCSDELKKLREEVYRKALSKLEHLLRNGRPYKVFKIMAPTGSGKTATALAVALRLRRHIEEKYGITPRIIYCLPYINIIEQTHQIIENMFTLVGLKNSPELILKHHHLYPVAWGYMKKQDNGRWTSEDVPLEKKLLFYDSWESEIVVTTFMQLFHTLFGIHNRMLLKLHKIFGSIIILDEIQTLPMEYWVLIRRGLETLAKYSWLIMMSATTPDFLAPSNAVSLVDECDQFYMKLNRVVYKYEEQPMTIDSVADYVGRLKTSRKSVAVVVNTISSSVRLYQLMRGSFSHLIPLTSEMNYEDLIDADTGFISYLSTNIIPRERRERINLLRKALELGKEVLVICTQVIEAGVDLDFDTVVRDLSPLDSIVQSGGRCNRHGLKDKGEVHIVKILDQKGRPTYSYVYGNLSVETVTSPILNKVFDEKELNWMIRQYFDKVVKTKDLENSDKSREIIECGERLNMKCLENFRLIDEQPKVSVFVEIDHEASERLRRFRELWAKRKNVEIDNPYGLRAMLRVSRIELEDYVVETWHDDWIPSETIVDDIDVRYIECSKLKDYYDFETGLRYGDGVPASIW